MTMIPLTTPKVFTQTATQYNITQMIPNVSNGTLVANVVLADGYGKTVAVKQLTIQTVSTDTTTAILTKILNAVMAL